MNFKLSKLLCLRQLDVLNLTYNQGFATTCHTTSYIINGGKC